MQNIINAIQKFNGSAFFYITILFLTILNDSQSSTLSEILKQPSKKSHTTPTVVFDIDETICKSKRVVVEDLESISKKMPGSVVIPYCCEGKIYNHLFFPDFGEVFVEILQWGWNVNFFSSGAKKRNEKVLKIFLRNVFAPYSDSIDNDLEQLLQKRIRIFSNCDKVVSREIESDVNRQYEANGLFKKDLRVLGVDLLQVVLVDDDRSFAVGGEQYPILKSNLLLELRALNLGKFCELYQLNGNIANEISRIADEIFPENDYAAYILGVFSKCRDLMSDQKLGLRTALINLLTIKKRPDDLQENGPCIQYSSGIANTPGALAKVRDWLQTGKKHISSLKDRKLGDIQDLVKLYNEIMMKYYFEEYVLGKKIAEFQLSNNPVSEIKDYIKSLKSEGFINNLREEAAFSIKILRRAVCEKSDYSAVKESEYEFIAKLTKTSLGKIIESRKTLNIKGLTDLLAMLLRAVDPLCCENFDRIIYSFLFGKKYICESSSDEVKELYGLLEERKLEFKYYFDPSHIVIPGWQSSTPILFVRMLRKLLRKRRYKFICSVIEGFTKTDSIQAAYALDLLINWWCEDNYRKRKPQQLEKLEKCIRRLLQISILNNSGEKQNSINFDTPIEDILVKTESLQRNIYGNLDKYKCLHWFLKLGGRSHHCLETAPEYMLTETDFHTLKNNGHVHFLKTAADAALNINLHPSSMCLEHREIVKRTLFLAVTQLENLGDKTPYLKKIISFDLLYNFRNMGKLIESDKSRIIHLYKLQSNKEEFLELLNAPNLQPEHKRDFERTLSIVTGNIYDPAEKQEERKKMKYCKYYFNHYSCLELEAKKSLLKDSCLELEAKKNLPQSYLNQHKSVVMLARHLLSRANFMYENYMINYQRRNQIHQYVSGCYM